MNQIAKRHIFFYSLLLFSVFSLFHFTLAHEGETDAGFVKSDIWYSGLLQEGETVKIHTAVFNFSAGELSGTVDFYDKNVILGSHKFSVPAGEVAGVSVDWKVTAGDHLISAKIVDSKIILSGGKIETALLEDSTTESDRQFVSKKVQLKDNGDATSGEVKGSTYEPDALEEDAQKAESFLNGIVNSPVVQNVEIFRKGKASNFGEKIDEINFTLAQPIKQYNPEAEDETQREKLSGIPQSMKRPLQYVSLFFYQLLRLIFGSPLIFYLSGALI